ncbi:hypothetical protein D3C71_1748140 [compost metagenome]
MGKGIDHRQLADNRHNHQVIGLPVFKRQESSKHHHRVGKQKFLASRTHAEGILHEVPEGQFVGARRTAVAGPTQVVQAHNAKHGGRNNHRKRNRRPKQLARLVQGELASVEQDINCHQPDWRDMKKAYAAELVEHKSVGDVVQKRDHKRHRTE